MKYVDSGNGKMPLISLIALLSISLTVNLPGLAVSPIMGKLKEMWPDAPELQIQLLTVLPNLVTIPFILCAGKICNQKNQMFILGIGLAIFTLTGIIYFFANQLIDLILLGCLLGVGVGLVIPLAASLISQYFSGQARQKELGMKSSLSNFTVIFATLFVGWVAEINWHMAFIVYMIPIIPLCLLPFMTNKYIAKHRIVNNPTPAPTATNSKSAKPGFIAFPGKTAIKMLFCLMGLYFIMTYGTEVVSYYLPFSMDHYGLSTGDVGVATAMFFLAATVSGFLLTHFIKMFKQRTMQIAILLCVIGLILIPIFPKDYWAYIVGVFIMGLGYGVIQPVIYDKTSYVAPTEAQSTSYFSYLLTCNYIGISTVPFIISGAKDIFGAGARHDVTFSFLFNGCIIAVVFLLALWKRKSFVYEADPDFYDQLNPPIPGLATQSSAAAPAAPKVATVNTPAPNSATSAQEAPKTDDSNNAK
ncbi:MAG: MFS transporter [Muribaculaceae bacterium]|nr:MFS transporter [Muribaculaceae bacterium]